MKTPEEITRWCDMMLKRRPNIEDTNFFNSIKDYMKEQRPQGECEKCSFKHTEKCDVCINRLRNMQSEPDRPQDDLISREALRDIVTKISKTYTEMSANQLGYDILNAINNAPAVLFPLTVKIKDNITDEDIEVLKRFMKDYKPQFLTLETERPQGEWKVYGTQGGIPITDYCSNCKYEMKWYKNKYNFCPNCGAYMTNRSMEGLGLLHKGEEE